METSTKPDPVTFARTPETYNHWKLSIDGPIARLVMAVQEDKPLRPGYQLKLNSYDLGVDIELADAVQRLRFEHPEVRVRRGHSARTTASSAPAPTSTCSASSTHAFKVNFCKFTNETRLAIEDASAHSGQQVPRRAQRRLRRRRLRAGARLRRDRPRRRRQLRREPARGAAARRAPGHRAASRASSTSARCAATCADVFCTMAEGIKGKRAVEWNLVDEVATQAAASPKPWSGGRKRSSRRLTRARRRRGSP